MIRWNVPLPGPFVVSGPARGDGSGCLGFVIGLNIVMAFGAAVWLFGGRVVAAFIYGGLIVMLLRLMKGQTPGVQAFLLFSATAFALAFIKLGSTL